MPDIYRFDSIIYLSRGFVAKLCWASWASLQTLLLANIRAQKRRSSGIQCLLRNINMTWDKKKNCGNIMYICKLVTVWNDPLWAQLLIFGSGKMMYDPSMTRDQKKPHSALIFSSDKCDLRQIITFLNTCPFVKLPGSECLFLICVKSQGRVKVYEVITNIHKRQKPGQWLISAPPLQRKNILTE